MSTASDQAAPLPPPPPAPSIFISYASEDRTAARALRDALTAAGLDVWYDENELGGGDSWDQKIRRQIRDCEYFMPVISATTNARKEGYFRREWRLATDRSLDMADDVLFLIPVTIDGTNEQTARVPDKFLSVQWLRLPGGNATPALHHLVRRILAGNHQALTRPPMAFNRPPITGATVAPFGQPPPLTSEPPPFAEPPPLNPNSAAAARGHFDHLHPDAPSQIPPMPHVPEKGGFLHGVKFILEIMWWALTAAWMLFKRLPRWARIIVIIWIVVTMFSVRNCSAGSGDANNRSGRDSRSRQSGRPPKDVERAEEEAAAEAAKQAVKTVVDQFAQAARDARKSGNNVDLARLGTEISRSFAAGGNEGPNIPFGKRLVLVPFAKLAPDDAAEKITSATFASLYGRLSMTHAREIGLLRHPPGATDTSLLARAKQIGASFVLIGNATGEGEQRVLTVRVLAVADGTVKWEEAFPLASADPSEIADKIADKADDVLPRREPRPPPPSPTPKQP